MLLQNLQPLMGPSQQKELQALRDHSTQIYSSSYPNGPPPSTPRPFGRTLAPTSAIQMSNIDDPDTDFFNYKNLPPEVKDRIVQRTDPMKHTLGSSMTRFRNSSTINSRGEMHECNFILHPITTKKWLVTRSGAVFNTGTMTTQDTKNFLTNFPKMLGNSAAFYYIW